VHFEPFALAPAPYADQFFAEYQFIRAKEPDNIGVSAFVSGSELGRSEFSGRRSVALVPKPEVPGGHQSALIVPGMADIHIALLIDAAVEPRRRLQAPKRTGLSPIRSQA
jgi:hypothetical protein